MLLLNTEKIGSGLDASKEKKFPVDGALKGENAERKGGEPVPNGQSVSPDSNSAEVVPNLNSVVDTTPEVQHGAPVQELQTKPLTGKELDDRFLEIINNGNAINPYKEIEELNNIE